MNKATIGRVIASFKPYKWHALAIAVLVLTSVFLGLLQPFFLRIIINDGLLQKNLHVVALYSIYTILATLGGTALNFAYGYLSVLLGQDVMRDFRNDLYEHLQGMSLRFFTGTRTGEIQSRLSSDVGGLQSVVTDTATNLLANVATVISSLIAMAALDWRLTLLSVGILPLFALLSSWVGNRMRKIRQTIQAQVADLTATMGETLSVSGMLLTKTSGRRALTVSKFKGENQAMTNTSVSMAMTMRMFFMLFQLSFSITPVLVYWLAGYLAIGHDDSRLTIGTIVAFTALQGRMFFPLTQLLSSQVELMSSMALFDRIFEYLDMPQEITDAPNAIEIKPEQFRGEVRFEDVTFRYSSEQETPTLDGVNLDAKPGQLVALVGPSGAGKTTLTYLIARLYDVESGGVFIDGHDVRQIKLDALAGGIAVVTQETFLVHDTIRENLRYGRPNATDPEIEAAAKAAAIHDHIAGLPEGYDTIVGERGYKLSGGEKQRIAIARAILKDPRILILDEATSSLDSQSERLIQAALAPLMQGRTTFAIAHRLSTIRAADQILVVQAGRIVEQGTHQSLLELDGEYARLYHVQFEHASEPVS